MATNKRIKKKFNRRIVYIKDKEIVYRTWKNYYKNRLAHLMDFFND